jgi:thiol-disulfide isomerase/thioredoxin
MKNLIAILFLCVSTFAFSQNWKNNLEEAKSIASTENKPIILVFSGSDWCGPCIKLDRNIWQSDAFKKEANLKWILVKADFPKKKANQLSETQTKTNKLLAEKYNPNGNFPLVVVLDKDLKVTGMTTYKNINPEAYIALLHSLEKK